MAARKFLVPIALPVDPVNPLEASTKQYVDNKASSTAPANAAAAAAVGTGTTYARADHVHQFPAQMLSTGTNVQGRNTTDGAVGGKPTDAGIIIVPYPSGAHGSWAGTEWALIGCYPSTNDTAIWNNLRVQTGLFVTWTTPKSAPAAMANAVMADALVADHFDGQGIEVGAAISALLDHIATLEDRIAALEARAT